MVASDASRIMNPRPARNQIEGAVVMGVAMAMLEETIYDSRSGAPINNNLADYIVAVNADTPEIDVTFLDYPDYEPNALGARGVGEIGLTGMPRRSQTRHSTRLAFVCVISGDSYRERTLSSKPKHAY
jgi:CO/xanthine dehydrogenase Mo-binding subunit